MATLFLHLGSEGKNICFARGAVSQRGLIATNGHTEWLRLDRHGTFVSDRGFRYDRQVFLQAVHVLIQPNPQIQVVYQTTEVSEPTLTASEADWVDIQTVENQVVVGGNVAEPTIFDVRLTVDRSTTHLSLSLFPRERVYDVAIDAGSEASQLLIHLRGNEEGCQRHFILDGLRRHFGIPEGEYDQEDEDAHLYLSRFYWNSQNEDSQGSHFRLPNATSPLLFVTRRSDTNKQLLPAVKVHFLSSLTHKRTWSVHKIYQSILASFLMEALYQIAERNQHERVAVVVNMLVPNMLSQNDHAALAQAMNEFVQSTRFDELKPKGFDGYVEIRLVSESDASLLGYLEQQKKQQNGRYCVIDMGRGTTDISVVDVDAAKAIAISRQGFLGAGNVINQAIFQEAVLHFVPLNEYPSKLEALLRMEPAKLWSIEKAIERLKRLNDPSPNPDTPTTPQLELDKIIQRIEGLTGIPTTYKMLNNAIDQLVAEVVKRVPDKIDIICLTGRAFLFPPLTKKMVAALSKRTKNIKFDAAKAKEVCLLGSLATRKLDASRIGVPIAYDCTKGFGEPTLKERMISSVQSCKGWFSFEKISSSVKKYEKRLNGEEPIQKKEEVQSAHVAKVVDEDEVMRAGTPIHCFGSATRFRLGDVVYHADHLPNDGETRLFFDGAHFFIRTAESRYLLQKVMACPNDERFLADSLFPYGLQFDNQLISKGNPHINTQQS